MPRWDENGRPIPDAPQRWDEQGRPITTRDVTPAEQAALDYTRRIAGVSAMAAKPAPARQPVQRGRQRAATPGQALAEDIQRIPNSGTLTGIAAIGDQAIWSAAPQAGRMLEENGLSPSQIIDRLGLTYTPQTTAGEYADTMLQFAPNAAMPGGLVARSAAAILPALASETAGQFARGQGYDQNSEDAWRFAGALGAGALTGLRGSKAPRVNRLEAGAEQAGVHLSPPARARAERLIRRGRAPEQVAALEASAETPVPVPMRRGDVTLNPKDQLAENLALRGAYGERPAAIMQGIVARQREALGANVDAIADNIGGGARRPLGEGATPAAERLDQMRLRGEEWVDGAYAAARDAGEGAMLHRDMGITARSRLLEGLADYRPDFAPRVFSVVDDLTSTGRPIPLKDVFAARQHLTALRADGGVEGNAAGKAVRALDGFIGQVADTDAVYGDPNAVALWRQAIGARRTLGQTFQGGDLLETLTERTSRGGESRAPVVDPREAADAIFGRGGMGRRANQVRDLERVRSVLGDGPEWNALRAEHFQRLARAADGGVEGGVRQFSGVKIQKAWQDFLRDNRQLADTLYTPAEQRNISTFASIAARVTSSVRGGDNASNTSVAMLKLLPAILRNIPFVGQIGEGVVRASRGDAVVRNAFNPTPGKAPPVPVFDYEGTTGAAVAGSAAFQSQERRPR